MSDANPAAVAVNLGSTAKTRVVEYRPDGPPVDEPAVISAHNVRKVFRTHTAGATSLKERLIRRDITTTKDFVAIDSFSVDIAAGSTVGLIGPNGSGKSTMLKILSGILRPSSGTVTVRGRVASLLELGAGFNSELTGRENVYLNAALLGLSRHDTDRAMASIIEFSELENFIDEPVKHYSSGMYVRLGFSVAIHVDPDILLVDEVLAVGDEAFQRKCMDKIHEFQEQGRTILFVSHSLSQVQTLCTRAIVLNQGVVVDDGEPDGAIDTLRRILGTDEPAVPVTVVPDDNGFDFAGVYLTDAGGTEPVDRLDPMAAFDVVCELDLNEHWAALVDRVEVVAMGPQDFPLFFAGAEGDALPHTPGRWSVRFSFTADRTPMRIALRLAVQVMDATGRPLAHTRSPGVHRILDHPSTGMLQLPHSRAVTVRAIDPVLRPVANPTAPVEPVSSGVGR